MLRDNAAVQVTRTVIVSDTTAPVITLTGDAEVTLECGAAYSEAGATAADVCDGELTESITLGGDVVDTATPGAYVITYDVADAADNAAVQVMRTVTVSDTTAPVITLTGDAEVTLECGAAYSDAGATASDVCDGELTESISVGGDAVDTATPGAYVITYDVADAAGNNAVQVTRTVIVSDTTAPVITLTGDAEVTLNVGRRTAMRGATAADVCDGELTESITIGGDAVDTATAGSIHPHL